TRHVVREKVSLDHTRAAVYDEVSRERCRPKLGSGRLKRLLLKEKWGSTMPNRLVVSIASGIALAVLIGPAIAKNTCGKKSNVKDQCVCRVLELHPTQLAVGMIEVRDKESDLSSKKPSKLDRYLKKHPEPAVKGPGGTLFITDHHHLARAAADL